MLPSLARDQGVEMSEPARLRIDAGVADRFCDPHSPWQRGTKENTNGLLRQYFAKGTDLSVRSEDELAAVAAALNWQAAQDAEPEHAGRGIDEAQQTAQRGVATTVSTRAMHLRGLRPQMQRGGRAPLRGLGRGCL